jgi:integrase/recombinase XerD
LKVTASQVNEILESWAKRALDSIPAERRGDVQKFLEHLNDDNKSVATLKNYLDAIRTLNHGKKPYKQLTEDEMRRWARIIDREYKDSSAMLYKCEIKRFIRWIHTGQLKGDSYPACVSWITLHPRKRSYGREILSQDEVKRLVDVTDNQRDRALIFTAYESGCRASELVNLKIGDVSFDEYSAILRVGKEQGKTGERRIRLFESTPDIQLWISMNPGKDNPNAPLWPSAKFKNQPIQRRGFAEVVAKYAKKAGIPKEKRLSPHSFRHSRATHLATVLKEAQMREFFGWTPSSNMPSIYVHLSGRDVDKTLFEHYGIKEPENGNGANPLKKQVCPRCSAENSVTARFCWRCWIAFDTYKADDITAIIMEEFIKQAPELLGKILKEKGLDQKIAELVPSAEKQAA